MLCGHSALFSETFPTSGTWDGTGLYPLPPPGHRTAGNGCSSPPGLLPTPSASNVNDGESLESWEARRQRNLAKHVNGNGQGTPLAIAAQQLLKTPTAQLGVNGGSQHPDKRKLGGHGPTLADQVEHLLPTPAAADSERTSATYVRGNPTLIGAFLPTPQAADSRRGTEAEMGGARPSGQKRPDGLGTVVTLLPTPTVADSRNSRNATAGRSPESTGHSGTTLSDVFWSGDPTPELSAGGKGSRDAGLRGQPSPGGPESD